MILAPYKRLIPPRLGVFFCRQLWPENAYPYLQGFIGDAYPAEGEATGKVNTTQVIKSALALPVACRIGRGATPPARLCSLSVWRNNTSGLER